MTRLIPPVYYAAAIVLAIVLHLVAPVATIIPEPARWFGLIVMAVGLALGMSGFRQFRQRGTTLRPLQVSSALVTDGIFAWTRNPMYLSMVLFVAGIAILERSASPWLAVAALAVVLDRGFIRREEMMLAAAFGAEFDRYRERTRRWI